jgi:penicillin G amidase
MYAREQRGRRSRRVRRLASALGAVVVSVALLGILGFGYGTIPALGPALDPGRGAWTSATGGDPVTTQTLRVPGLSQAVTVSFTKEGIASINARNDHDMFLALGYVHAKFRLSEMDAERRLGEGRLAQLAGPADLASDEFELRLGLLRTAQNEWAHTTGPARQALLAYSRGVNDDIAQVRAAGDWPALFTLTGTYPRPWTPVDSLVIQGVLTQELDYTTSPLDYALLQRSLGAKNAMAWFPVLPANTWTPYDSGPYVKEPLTAVPPDVASSAPNGRSVGVGWSGKHGVSLTAAASSPTPEAGGGATIRSGESGAVAEAAGQLLAQLSQLPAGQIHEYPDSNAWAANGPAVAGGGTACAGGNGAPAAIRCAAALLGGDPHLLQTLPSVWYEVALSAPGYQAAGVTVPGVPGVLLGHNAHIAWSLTNTQNEATFYYAEQIKGDSYFWRGSWRPMTVVHYTIPVRGGASVDLKVDITAHGPVMTQAGQTMAVDWMGNVPSDDLSALLGINQASNFGQFKAALAGWRAPTQNFTYADNDPVPGSAGTSGNIGVYAAGYYPQVPSGCQPWLPMPGTGSCDITGVIPYNAIPQTYDPPSHLIATDNQRPVSAAYPYYIGTSADFFDPGYRAGYAYQSMRADEPLSASSIASLQSSVTDSLAAAMVPKLLAALRTASLTPAERSAAAQLSSWNFGMNTGSAAATVWWTFWADYVSEVFQPWWEAGHVPVGKDPLALAVGTGLVPLDEDLQAWTSSDPGNPAFGGPSGRGFSGAPAAMIAAFGGAVSHLSSSLRGAPPSWTWGKVHSRAFPSVTGANGLGYGPRAAGGDPFTEDAADGGMTASTGPSWRMVASLSAGSAGGVSAEGVYPGGQSEDPASPWYANLVPLWWNGQYLPVPVPGNPAGDGARWTLSACPGGRPPQTLPGGGCG